MNQLSIRAPQKSNSLAGRPTTLIFSSLAIIIIAISLAFFTNSFGKPAMGTYLSLENKTWRVSSIDINGLAKRVGVKVGDLPVEINYQPAEAFLAKYETTGNVDQSLIKEAAFDNEQGGLISVDLKSVPFFGSALAAELPIFIVCLIFWAVGLYVFFKARKSSPALLLGLCSLLFGLMLCANIAGTLSISFAYQLSAIIAIFGPWLFIHFFLILPEERAKLRSNPLINLVYLPPTITTVFFFLVGWADGQPTPKFNNYRLFEIGVGLLAVVGVVILNYFRAGSPRTRQQMKIILTGCLASLIPFLVLYLLPRTVSGNSFIPPGYSILFIVFIPVAMGYAVVTQKLMDIDFFIRRTVIYGLITIVMAAVLSIGIFLVINSPTDFGILSQAILSLLLGAAATALFGPAKKGIETLVDKFLYKDRYDYRQIILGLSSSLKNLKELQDISRLVVGTTVKALNLAGACLFIEIQPGYLIVNAAQGTFTDRNRQEQLKDLISTRTPRTEFPNPATILDPEVAFLIPLAARDKEIGYLFISNKASRQAFSSDDIYLLQGLASVAAVSLRSALLAHDVSLRDTFVSIASHELHAPLASVMGYAGLLISKERPPAVRKQWLQNIHDCAQQLTHIVDDLLNVSRIQTGRIGIQVEPVDAAEVLREKFNLVSESSEKHEFIINLDPDLPKSLVDRSKFGQIVANLLSNAIKYSPNGGPITLAANYDRMKQQIVVSVADQGIGIGPDDKKSLFTTFHRIDRPETRSIKGVGLGLYIVKEWTEAMQGQVWLESELNKGSTFYVAFPAVKNGLPAEVDKPTPIYNSQG